MATIQLPPSLNLPPHLSAHKYFLVCTLTVAAWDTLVLSPRTWRLFKTPGWPALKILFHFMRIFMPVEFIIVAVAFFDTKWSQASCQHFFLFEPICTAILLAAASAVHVIRIHAIYDKNRAILTLMSALYAAQIVITAVACGFYLSVPLEEGQGCIAGPKHAWVGIYWIAPTLLYTTSLVLALNRSRSSLASKPISLWKLMLRDGLNLYAAIFLVNLANVLFWFIINPTGPNDSVRTIVTSMAAVLTTSMSLRIVLGVRGSLDHGGSFNVAGSSNASSSRVLSARSQGAAITQPHTYTLDEMRAKPEGEGEAWSSKPEADSAWGPETDGKSSVHDVVPVAKVADLTGEEQVGVKITIDREVGYDPTFRRK